MHCCCTFMQAVLNSAVPETEAQAGHLAVEQSLEVGRALQRLQALLSSEHNAIHAIACFMMARVLTPIQIIKVSVHSWPRIADSIAIACTVAQCDRS